MRFTTRMVRVTSPVAAMMTSPSRTERAGLTGWPPTRTLPPAQAEAATLRVLYRRTAQSHLSMRTCPTNCILLKTAIRARAKYPIRLPHELAAPRSLARLQPVRSIRKVQGFSAVDAVPRDPDVPADDAAEIDNGVPDARGAANGFQDAPGAAADADCSRAPG